MNWRRRIWTVLVRIWVPVFIIGGIAIAFAAYLARDVMRRDTGTPEMRAVSDLIFEGAMAYMRRQYQTIAMLAVVTIVLGIIVYLVENDHQQTRAIVTAGALLGASSSGVVRVHRHASAVPANIRPPPARGTTSRR